MIAVMMKNNRYLVIGCFIIFGYTSFNAGSSFGQNIIEKEEIFASELFGFEIDSIKMLFQGTWFTEKNSMHIIVVEDTIWTIYSQDTVTKYRCQINRTVDNIGERNVNISLFIMSKDWKNFKGNTENDELMLYFIKRVRTDSIHLQGVFGDNISLNRTKP